MKENNFYVYEWFNVDNNEVFYVGKGKNGRYKNINQRNKYFKNYINKYNCDVRKIRDNLTEFESFEVEKELIKKYKEINQCKCNITNGGEGSTFEIDSWNYWFQKLQCLYNFKDAMNGMDNEEEYSSERLKTKDVNELKKMYDDYIEYLENIKMAKELGFYKKFDYVEITYQQQEITMLTELISKRIANNNRKFKKFLDCKTEFDFITLNINSDAFLEIMVNDLDYITALIKFLINVLEFMKTNSRKYNHFNQKDKIEILIKRYSFINNKYIKIQYNTLSYNPIRTVTINVYDIIWGLIIYKDKTIYELIYSEIIYAPFVIN